MQLTTKRLSIWALVVAAILSIPYFANAPWTLSDFIIGGVALFGFATVYELTTRNMTNKNHKIVTGVLVLFVLLVFWGWAATGSD